MRRLPFVVPLAILAVLAVPFQSYSNPNGDISGDGQVGLPDAITALQIVSGDRPQSSQTIDFREYFWVPGIKYDYISNYSYLSEFDINWHYSTHEYSLSASLGVFMNEPVLIS